jgi:hypothetical protein
MNTENFKEFIGEILEMEELPCIVGGIETDENIRLLDIGTADMDVIQ